jgi:branched-chain amino acid transport system substrate-binding protein
MNTAFVEAAKKNGVDVVFNKGYPFPASDLQPLVREAMATSPDAFIAMSYPPETFALPEQCKIVGFNPQIMYLAIGGVFPGLKGKYGDNVNGILVYGGSIRTSRAWPNTTRRIRRCSTGHRRRAPSTSMADRR